MTNAAANFPPTVCRFINTTFPHKHLTHKLKTSPATCVYQAPFISVLSHPFSPFDCFLCAAISEGSESCDKRL